MTKKNQDLLNLFGALGIGSILILGTIAVVRKHINVNLEEADKITGSVTSAKIIQHTSEGKLNVTQSVFSIRLANSDLQFATFRPGQDYSTLTREIKLGDTITISYRTKHSAGLNLDVFQISKKNKILQDYTSYRKNHEVAAWASGLAGLLVLSIGCYPYYRNYRRKNKQIQTK